MDKQSLQLASDYRDKVHHRIEALMPVLAQAAIGNYNQDVPLDGPTDEFSELYVGIQLMLEAMREKVSQLEELTDDLAEIVAKRSTELFGSETRFSVVADTANDAIITIDNHGHIIYLNRAAGIIFGYPLSKLKGQPLTRLVPSLNPHYLKVLPLPPSGGNQKLQKPVQAMAEHRRGRQFPVELSFATWQLNRKTNITVIVRDLTVHHMLVEKLAQRTNQLESKVAEQTRLLRVQLASAQQNRAEIEALLNSIGEGVVAVNKSGRVFFVNQEFARLARTEPTLLKGRYYYSVVPLEDEAGKGVSRAERPMFRALKTGTRAFANSLFYRPPDGQVLPVSITATPVIIKGKIVGAIDIIRDITKEREADQLKSDFVSIASHQLRTPATAVKGLLSLLIDGYEGPLTSHQARTIQAAYTENEHELKLVDDMLDVAKLDAGEMKLEPSLVDVNKLIRTIVSEQQELIGQTHPIVVTARRAVKIRADPGKLHMVFENLITNAIKYSPKQTRITVTIRHAGDTATIRVKDHGIGIAPRDVPHLFKRFSRAPNATKTHAGGSGLGLYLAKKIVDLHQGKITVDSQLGSGSIFTVTLPRQT